MIKCEVIKEFTLKKFDELKNIKRRRIDTKGRLYEGDTFECTKEMADYLMGDNKDKQVVVKVIEIIPENKLELNPKFQKEVAEKSYEEIKKSFKKKK